MNGNYYIVYSYGSVVGVNKKSWGTHNNLFKYWWVSDSDTDETWSETDVALTREQVIDLLEFKTDLDGDDVYKFNNGFSNSFVDELKEDTEKAMHRVSQMGNYSNAELIEILNYDGDEKGATDEMVTKPPHYMLEDGTEVKHHIRSLLGDDGFKSWAIGNAIKYVSRYEDKGKPVQDLKKAQENIQIVIDVLGEQDGLE